MNRVDFLYTKAQILRIGVFFRPIHKVNKQLQ